jgi:ubiquinone/menaquinone biosynthesis C-methylase UbiE
MAANYNNSAWFYDLLSRIVYGKALINAQVYLLKHIPSNSRILIVGGGTGWILEKLANLHHSGLEITYVEVSVNMMTQSKKRNKGLNEVVFINEAIENVALPNYFDVIITSFLFDSFTEQTLQRVFNHINKSLITKGIWLNCDFQLTGKWLQQVLLKSMFWFFKTLCNIEASRLPDIKKQFYQHGYECIARQNFLNDFIVSEVYKAP